MADERPPPPTPAQIRSALRRDGSVDVERVGMTRSTWTDLFHFLVTRSWGQLFGLVGAAYLVINLVFAGLLLVGGGNIANARPGSFADAFAFSVQTFATIGYGVFAPATAWAHLLVTAEALAGILFSALATGLMFSKFARPSARVLFADTMPIYLHEGVPTLSLRMANSRFNQIVEASVKVRISRMERTAEGVLIRRLYDLKLVRDANPTFALSWQIFHPIDADSPLYGVTPESLAEQETIFIVVLTGTDDTVVATVHARTVYMYDQILFNRRYVDVISGRPGDGKMRIDYTRFHETMPMPEAQRIPGLPVSEPPADAKRSADGDLR